jgi:cyanophycin synthetase
VRVLLDFGHNPDGIRGVLQLTEALRRDRPGRLVVVAGAAGDRSEHDIAEVASAIRAAQPHRVLLRDLGGYLRGRAPGEVPRMFQDALCGLGFPAEAVATVGSEVEALRSVFDAALPGDFVVVLVHLEQAAVHAFLDAQGE